MGRLTSIKPRLAAASTLRVQTFAPARPGMVERKRGATGVRDRAKIRARDCGLCQNCKRHGYVTPVMAGEGAVDHIVPLWKGGSDEDTNKELLCDPCHNAKTAREARERGAHNPRG